MASNESPDSAYLAPSDAGNVGPGARLFVALQYLLPQHGLSRLVNAATRSRTPWFKNALISGFVRAFRPDLSDAAEPQPLAFESFNEFFTRALRPGARPLPADADALACPVDGTVSQAGRIDGDALIQAKGRSYTLEALLAGRESWVQRFRDGHFATIYLAPYNYHRIHMCCDGRLDEAWYVPGRLFSVNRVTAALVPGLFARNERVVCAFERDGLPHACILVGALNVGSMDTVWHGEVTPRAGRAVETLQLIPGAPAREAARGAELGRFNMGSTVILLFPRGAIEWAPHLQPGRVVRMGEPIGRLLTAGT